jgi:exopolyphosphatase/pppGpp-phosphohydrolase
MDLTFSSDVTTLSTEDGGVVTLGPSPAALAAACFRHDPPTAHELEHAIDIVEDALMAARPPRGSGATLTTLGPALRRLPGLEAIGAALSRQAVEALFQQLASVASESPNPNAAAVADHEVTAALLITRECMHHLDFEWIQVGRSPHGAAHPMDGALGRAIARVGY